MNLLEEVCDLLKDAKTELARLNAKLSVLELRIPVDLPGDPKPERITKLVASHFGMDVEELLGKCREQWYVQARFTLVWLLRYHARPGKPMPMEQVAKLTGRKEHGATLNALKVVNDWRQTKDPAWDHVERLINVVKGWEQ